MVADIKQQTAAASVVASALLVALKLAAGVVSGSLGIIAEAAHSTIDLGATILTLVAVRISGKPADHDHPYGHGKVESIAALAETALLFLTSGWIVVTAARHLIEGGAEIEPSWLAAGVMAISIVVDLVRSRQLARIARETQSAALAADALHFRADIYSSAVVLAGLGLAALGVPWGDPAAAIGVALFVLRAGYSLGRSTIDTLIDTEPAGVTDRVRDALRNTPEVARIDRVRASPRGSNLAVEVEVAVARTLPLERVSDIQADIARRIRAATGEAEISVQTTPLALDDETILDRVRVIAAGLDVPVHHVTVQHVGDRISVSFDLEVDGDLVIVEAHRVATRLERAIRSELGEDIEVESHIEPLLVDAVSGTEPEWRAYRDARDLIEGLAEATPGLIDAHDIRIRLTGRGTYVSLHCHVAAEATVEAAHDAASALEQQIRNRLPEVRRIIVHTEPPAAAA